MMLRGFSKIYTLISGTILLEGEGAIATLDLLWARCPVQVCGYTNWTSGLDLPSGGEWVQTVCAYAPTSRSKYLLLESASFGNCLVVPGDYNACMGNDSKARKGMIGRIVRICA